VRDISNGGRREVTDVETAADMETAVTWLLRGGVPDTGIHVYLNVAGGFGVWLNAPPADRPDPLREMTHAR
jgi:hypothetical protein